MELPRRRPLAGYLLTGAFVVCLAAGLAALFFWGGTGGSTTVPDLQGLELEQAAARSKEAGLALVAPQGAGETGSVVKSQDPGPGTEASRGDAVSVVLARPLRDVVVPELTGLGIDAATGRLADAGLSVGSVARATDSREPAGTVVRQDPTGGTTLREGSQVSLWTSQPTVAVPDLAGLSAMEADRIVQEAGLRMETLEETDPSGVQAPGTVVRQIPDPGTRLDPGSKVVAVINGSEAGPGSTAGESPASPLFRSLAAAYDFPVLFPATLPSQLALEGGSDNPRHMAGTSGEPGFEIRYTYDQVPGAGLVLMEGNWFEAGSVDGPRVEVRGQEVPLARDGDHLLLAWEEGGIRYAVRATGMEDGEIIEFANGLQPVEQP